MNRRIIIVGAGQAGVQVAMSLRQAGYDGEVLLVGEEPHVPYQRPPLSKQVLKKEWAAERCQMRHLEFYDQHGIDLLLGARATRLDARACRICLDDDSEWTYDALAVCSGSRLNLLKIAGADLPGVCYLRTIDHALDLSARLNPGARVVVIGGGYIGLEVAAAARSLGCDVVVVEALNQIMKRSSLPEIAAYLQRRHEVEGVTFLMGTEVAALVGNDRVTGVELRNGTIVPADTVMVGIGVRPDLRWIDGSGINTGRGVLVDESCRTNVENIYAAGDVAELRHPLLEGLHVLESVQNAVSQGKIVAAEMLGRKDDYCEAPWFWSEQYDCRLQMAGIPRANDRHIVRENPDTGGVSVFSIFKDQVHAVQSINSPRDYMVGRQLITRRIRAGAEELADRQFNLKDLL